MAGDTLYGGPIGAATGFADVALQKFTGKDMGETALAFVTGGKKKAEETQLASAAPATTPYSISDIVWNDAPLTTDPQPVPREQVAARMMDALDKYQAMKRAQYAPQISETF